MKTLNNLILRKYMVYEEWSQEEIDEYAQVEDRRLSGLYKEMGLSNLDLASRARYLAEEVLSLTGVDEEVLRTKLRFDGRPAALNYLEELAVIKLSNEAE